jgi:hypothetical protein
LHDDRRIRIRIREAKKHMDPVDPDSDSDPEHWKTGNKRSRRPLANGLLVLLQRQAMGILAQDTDFLIYQTSVPYYSIKKLDISTLRYD